MGQHDRMGDLPLEVDTKEPSNHAHIVLFEVIGKNTLELLLELIRGRELDKVLNAQVQSEWNRGRIVSDG